MIIDEFSHYIRKFVNETHLNGEHNKHLKKRSRPQRLEGPCPGIRPFLPCSFRRTGRNIRCIFQAQTIFGESSLLMSTSSNAPQDSVPLLLLRWKVSITETFVQTLLAAYSPIGIKCILAAVHVCRSVRYVCWRYSVIWVFTKTIKDHKDHTVAVWITLLKSKRNPTWNIFNECTMWVFYGW